MDAGETLRKSIQERDPRALLPLLELSLTSQQVDSLRKGLQELVIKSSDRDLLLQWAWHDESSIQKIGTTII